MPDMLERIIYTSRNRMAGSPETVRAAVEAILEAARHKNKAAGLTGALFFSQGCFTQILEGPRAEIERVFEVIQLDERHGDVALVAFEPIDGRVFSDWSMAFVDHAGGAGPDRNPVGSPGLGTPGFDLAATDPDAISRILKALTLQQEMMVAA